MRLGLVAILAASGLITTGAKGALLHDGVGITLPEPASLALLGAALMGFTKLLRKKLRS